MTTFANDFVMFFIVLSEKLTPSQTNRKMGAAKNTRRKKNIKYHWVNLIRKQLNWLWKLVNEWHIYAEVANAEVTKKSQPTIVRCRFPSSGVACVFDFFTHCAAFASVFIFISFIIIQFIDMNLLELAAQKCNSECWTNRFLLFKAFTHVYIYQMDTSS